jgi:hypothetical protein
LEIVVAMSVTVEVVSLNRPPPASLSLPPWAWLPLNVLSLTVNVALRAASSTSRVPLMMPPPRACPLCVGLRLL